MNSKLCLCSAVMVVTLFSLDPQCADAQVQSYEIAKDAESIIIFSKQAKLITAHFTIAKAEVGDDEICSVTPLTILDPESGDDKPTSHAVIKAMTHGITHVTLMSPDAAVKPVIIRVEVLSDDQKYKPLEDFIKARFPRTAVKLYPIPTSKKILAVGTVESDDQVTEIISMLTDENIDEDYIVNKLMVGDASNDDDSTEDESE